MFPSAISSVLAKTSAASPAARFAASISAAVNERPARAKNCSGAITDVPMMSKLGRSGQPMLAPSRANLDKVTELLQSDIGNATKFRQGGEWDIQRVKDDSGNYIFTKQYREFANVAVGYAFMGKGIGWWETAVIADLYAWKNSSFSKFESMDSAFRHLPKALTYDYATGAKLYIRNFEFKNPSSEPPFQMGQ